MQTSVGGKKLVVPDGIHNQFTIAEYVWVGGNGPLDIRSKTKVVRRSCDDDTLNLEEFPSSSFDGSQTQQARLESSAVIIEPCATFYDVVRPMIHAFGEKEGITPLPLKISRRDGVIYSFCEYTIFKDGKPLGWPSASARSFGGPTTQLGFPGPQGPYYCSVGSDVNFGRAIAEAHLRACLGAGVKIGGCQALAMPGQWSFTVGPCAGIEQGDHLTIARYMLCRVSEDFGCVVSFDPKPIPGDWNGTGCHTSFSTKKMRQKGGYEEVRRAVLALEQSHEEHISAYGEGNERRLTGLHETAPIDRFSWGVDNQLAHVCIPRSVERAGCGFLIDRRPASNMDPYVVTSLLFKSICLD